MCICCIRFPIEMCTNAHADFKYGTVFRVGSAVDVLKAVILAFDRVA